MNFVNDVSVTDLITYTVCGLIAIIFIQISPLQLQNSP